MNHCPPVSMPALTLALFDDAHDAEAARYRILAALSDARDAFTHNRLWPYLGDLVRLRTGLRALVSGADSVRESARAVDVDWESGRLIREPVPAPLAVELGRWAVPRIEKVLAEGRALYEFADEHAQIQAVGIVPRYHDEGFLVVSDETAVHALRYQMSPLAGPEGPYRVLRTVRLDLALDPLAPPHAWKARLAEAAPELAAPAAFRLHTEVDLPAEATLIPIAKRKLLGWMQVWGDA